jgi:transposase
VYADWKTVKVNIDYHVAVDYHFYSAPFQLVHCELEARITATTVELFHQGARVAAHARSFERGRFTTVAAHMPKSHLKHHEWTPSRLIDWARKVGPETTRLVEAILIDRPHPEQGYRSCLGILRLSRAYGAERLEIASARALVVRARSYRHIEAILKKGLDRVPPRQPPASGEPIVHENVRGKDYYR